MENRNQHDIGTTSACAENTAPRRWRKSRPGNYLRVRGEYPLRDLSPARGSELPPRARRIQIRVPGPTTYPGTTSACAENTNRFRAFELGSWNYLRVRGEYRIWRTTLTPLRELPPRARRIRHNIKLRGCPQGTTSACAENTLAHRADQQ